MTLFATDMYTVCICTSFCLAVRLPMRQNYIEQQRLLADQDLYSNWLHSGLSMIM